MSLELGLVLAAVGLLAAFFSGLLGIGGGLVVVPLLMYVPPALGLTAFDVRLASAIAVAQIAVATGAGTIAFVQKGLVYKKLVAFIVGAMASGAFMGGWISQFVPPRTLLTIFASMATLGALTMIVPIGGQEHGPEHPPFNRALAMLCGLVVGFGIGLVGGGAFLLVPAQVYMLGIPTRTAIGTGLAAGFPTAAAALVGKVLGGQLQLGPALVVCVFAVPGARLGAHVGARLSARMLRRLYAAFVLTVAVGLWSDVLGGA